MVVSLESELSYLLTLVSAYYDISLQELKASRLVKAANARKLVVYLLRKHHSLTYDQISLILNLPHDSVMHAYVKFHDEVEKSKEFAFDANALETLLLKKTNKV